MKRLLTIILALVALAAGLMARQPAPRVFVNPGHGGHESDDRNNPILGFVRGDTAGYWESNSNLHKGNRLCRMLRQRGYEVATSRVANTGEDDLDLFEIVALAANSGADLFIALHSNATGIDKRVNFPLALYRGYTGQPVVQGSDTFSDLLMKRCEANRATVWTHPPRSSGDWSFYTNWGHKTGLGVLRFNKLPAMLLEGTFHDYRPETMRLLNPDYCGLEAWNISLAIDDYFGHRHPTKGVLAGLLRDVTSMRPDTMVIHGPDIFEPVNGATVRLIDRHGKTVATYTTDNYYNGFYAFEGIEPGRYSVTVSHPAMAPRTVTVDVVPAVPTYCNFDLTPPKP